MERPSRSDTAVLVGIAVAWCLSIKLGVRSPCAIHAFVEFLVWGAVMLVAAVIGFVAGTRRVRIALALALVTYVPACLGVGFIESAIASDKVDALVAAIERYHAAHGVYPQSLKALQPRYIDAISTTSISLALYDPHYWPDESSYAVGYGGSDCGITYHAPLREEPAPAPARAPSVQPQPVDHRPPEEQLADAWFQALGLRDEAALQKLASPSFTAREAIGLARTCARKAASVENLRCVLSTWNQLIEDVSLELDEVRDGYRRPLPEDLPKKLRATCETGRCWHSELTADGFFHAITLVIAKHGDELHVEQMYLETTPYE